MTVGRPGISTRSFSLPPHLLLRFRRRSSRLLDSTESGDASLLNPLEPLEWEEDMVATGDRDGDDDDGTRGRKMATVTTTAAACEQSSSERLEGVRLRVSWSYAQLT